MVSLVVLNNILAVIYLKGRVNDSKRFKLLSPIQKPLMLDKFKYCEINLKTWLWLDNLSQMTVRKLDCYFKLDCLEPLKRAIIIFIYGQKDIASKGIKLCVHTKVSALLFISDKMEQHGMVKENDYWLKSMMRTRWCDKIAIQQLKCCRSIIRTNNYRLSSVHQ